MQLINLVRAAETPPPVLRQDSMQGGIRYRELVVE